MPSNLLRSLLVTALAVATLVPCASANDKKAPKKKTAAARKADKSSKTAKSAAKSAKGEKKESKADAEKRKALADLQTFVGQWKGVGQPERGSTKGSWIEESAWAWDFSGKAPAIVFQSPKGHFYAEGRITPGKEPKTYTLTAQLPEKAGTDTFTGKVDDEGRLVFRNEQAAENKTAQITMRLVAQGARLVALYERAAGTDRFARLAEVGYTRKNSGFGQGASGPECIVTGGAALIAVEYKGQTYYVCCTGCRDYFLENPEEVLTEYRERMAAKKKEKKTEQP